MIETGEGNLLESGAEALVNTVNTVGIMGRGVAYQIRRAFPANYKAYRAACERHEVQIGHMFVFEMPAQQARSLFDVDSAEHPSPRLIVNFPTKKHWKEPSRLEYVRAGLPDLVAVLKRHDVRSVAVPPLGCGLGGLDWRDVKPLIVDALASLSDVRVLLYEPIAEVVAAPRASSGVAPHWTAARAALVALVGRYLSGLMDAGITLLEIHKLVYFLQDGGEPLKLRFVAGHYGPYAENLRHVLDTLEGHYLSGYNGQQDRPDQMIDLIGNALAEAEQFLALQPATQERVERVGQLIEGFETPFGLELLSTVHWVARHGARTPEEAVQNVRAWNKRKQMFSPEQIATAWRVLESGRWLETPEPA